MDTTNDQEVLKALEARVIQAGLTEIAVAVAKIESGSCEGGKGKKPANKYRDLDDVVHMCHKVRSLFPASN